MRALAGFLSVCVILSVTPSLAAQPSPRSQGGSWGRGPVSAEGMADRMMAFDKQKDGKLTKDELTDARLHRLFDRADGNNDGVVSKDELTALFTKELAAEPEGRFGSRGRFGGPGERGFRGPGRGSGGRGRLGPPGGPGQTGMVMSAALQNLLELSDDQRQQLAELQKEVDARLDKILTDAQKRQLRDLRSRGPRGHRGPLPGRPERF